MGIERAIGLEEVPRLLEVPASPEEIDALAKRMRRAYRNLHQVANGGWKLQCPECLKTGFHKMDCSEA